MTAAQRGRNTTKLESYEDAIYGQEESAWVQDSLLNSQLSCVKKISHFRCMLLLLFIPFPQTAF